MRKTWLFLLAFCVAGIAEAQQQTFTYSVYFDLDQHRLTDDAKATLDAIPAVLTFSETYDIEILAHTDAQGGNSYNQRLSQRRAVSVLDYLAVQGLRTSQAVLRSFGEDHPVYTNENEEGRQKNRRVDVVVSAYVARSVDDLYALLNEGREQSYYINPQEANKVIAREGTMALIPANAFVDVDGRPVDADRIRLSIEENYTLSDMLLSRLSTVSGDQLLVSAGMVNIRAYAGDRELQLRPGANLGLGMPVQGEEGWDEEMQLFYGEVDPHAQTADMDWRPTNRSFRPTPPELWIPPRPVLEGAFNDTYRKPRFDERPPVHPSTPSTEPRLPTPGNTRLKLNFFQRVFLSASAKETQKQALYEERLDNYHKIRLPRYREEVKTYENALAKYREDSLAYEQKWADYLARVEKEETEFNAKKELVNENAYAEYREQLEKWEADRQARRELFENGYTTVGNVGQATLRRYFFESNQLGWINCDRFWNVSADNKMPVVVRDTDETEESIYIVFKEEMSILPVSKRDELYETTGAPVGAEIRIVGIKLVDGQAQMALVETRVGERDSYELAYTPKSLRDIQYELTKMD